MGTNTTHSLSSVAAEQRCDQYAEEFGLNAQLDPYLGTLFMHAGPESGIRVVSMPKSIGVLMRTRLLQLDIRAPVISHASVADVCGHDRRWQFLATAAPEDAALQTELAFTPVLLVHKVTTFLGLRISLPMPGDPRHIWIDPPVKDEIPLFRDLVDGIRHTFTTMGPS
ncbi:hypothetical protein [Nocardia brasiliensis]|uniref:hypothetical protein n=1 Tax=Nocardia brasiliensis TaxID=37326 RepID=UPI0024558C9D|nr:hypothetical protein [Nocardia brasiliensis]